MYISKLNPFNQFNHQIKLRLAHESIEYVKAFFIKLSTKEGDNNGETWLQ